ncbi:methionine biosynthesis protein MetW [Oleispirillum naphthae]|uniref:methionine biosynthesis protein MetW n=1 Tax=Oleispirillum naphthae TaxID=2838853 RepID=UPI0030823569
MAAAANHSATGIRIDLKIISEMVEDGSRVLDVGCGDGELLAFLQARRHADGRGMELSMSGVQRAVARGLAVIQGDADTDLADYPDGAFDYVILSKTLQATHNPRAVVEQMLRIGRHAIVSFPNFAHWRTRLDLLLHGRMPVNDLLPYSWYETPNIHFCTIRDFTDLCRDLGVRVKDSLALDAAGEVQRFTADSRWANLLAVDAVFLLEK